MKANSDVMLIDASSAGSNASAPRNETGMPSVTHRARRHPTTRASAAKTRTSPPAPLLSMSDNCTRSSPRQVPPDGGGDPVRQALAGAVHVAVDGARDVEHALIRPLTALGATPLHGRAGGYPVGRRGSRRRPVSKEGLRRRNDPRPRTERVVELGPGTAWQGPGNPAQRRHGRAGIVQRLLQFSGVSSRTGQVADETGGGPADGGRGRGPRRRRRPRSGESSSRGRGRR